MNGDNYSPALWERIVATVCAVSVVLVVLVIVLQKEPFADPNHVVLLRIVLSLAIGIIGAVVPGFLRVDLKGRGVAIRAGGALALFVISFFFSPTVIPHLDGKPPPVKPSKVDTSPLSKIQFYGGIKQTKAEEPTYKSFQEYLRETNKQLFDSFDQLVNESKQGIKKRGWTHVVAPSGIGKSTLFGILKEQLPESIHIIKLEQLKDLIKPNDPSGVSLREINDLMDIDESGKGPKSSMIGFGSPGSSVMIQSAPNLNTLLNIYKINLRDRKPAFIIIDSIDEIHPGSSVSLLHNIDNDLQSNRQLPDFCHVYIIGRPEGFAAYYLDSHPHSRPGFVELMPPRYQSEKDIEVVAELLRDTNHRSREDVDALLGLTEKKPFVFESVHLLSVAADFIKSAAQDFVKADTSDADIKSYILNQILERNSRSHNRPNGNSLDYVHLLEEIASRYTNVDEHGFFSVNWSDEIEYVLVRGQDAITLKYNVAKTLSRSGVAYMNPIDLRNPKFRFLPSWLHEHLVLSRNERVQKEYEEAKILYERKYGSIGSN